MTVTRMLADVSSDDYGCVDCGVLITNVSTVEWQLRMCRLWSGDYEFVDCGVTIGSLRSDFSMTTILRLKACLHGTTEWEL